jgi:ribokinase
VQAAVSGAQVVFVGAVGRDEAGKFAREALVEAGVTAVLEELDEPTGQASITVDDGGENCIVVDSGANAAIGETAVMAALREWSNAQPLVLVCQGECPAAIVDAVARFSNQGGHRFVLNLAPVIDLSMAALRTSNPLIVNESEAQSLLGGFEVQAANLAEALHTALGVPVVVTRGAQGADVVDDGGELVHVPALALTGKVVDSTGAGDALVGGTSAALSAGQSLVDAVRAGTQAARSVLSTRGAAAHKQEGLAR